MCASSGSIERPTGAAQTPASTGYMLPYRYSATTGNSLINCSHCHAWRVIPSSKYSELVMPVGFGTLPTLSQVGACHLTHNSALLTGRPAQEKGQQGHYDRLGVETSGNCSAQAHYYAL